MQKASKLRDRQCVWGRVNKHSNIKNEIAWFFLTSTFPRQHSSPSLVWCEIFSCLLWDEVEDSSERVPSLIAPGRCAPSRPC